jgi:hypothetical protein
MPYAPIGANRNKPNQTKANHVKMYGGMEV